MSYAFRIVNVFTVDGDRLSGNPLCVFEDARGLTDVQMQAIARQMNLSETTFILPSSSPRDPAEPEAKVDARVRIFTPGFEMPFAGHPTLGTASVVAGEGERERVTLEMLAGQVDVTRAGSSWTLRAAQPPVTREVDASPADLARMLGLPAHAIAATPLWVSTGVEQLVIPIASSELVRAARPDRALLERFGFSATRQEAMAYLWARDEGNPSSLTVRFFFTVGTAVLEDPATGSACANLGGWLVATGHPLPVRLTLRQGDAVGRPSRLHLAVETDGGIYVTGDVIELGRGAIAV
jgi:trans-2,3-dihydro-3-hydroxyanthranilate isomerase